MGSTAEISSGNVMSAIYHLGGPGHWPTSQRIAEYLKCDESDVRKILLDLRRKRLFTDRQRKGQRVWMPWEEA